MGQFDQLKKDEEVINASVENTGDSSVENNKIAESAPAQSAEELKAKEDGKAKNKIAVEQRIGELKKELIGENESTKYKVVAGEDIVTVARNTFRMAKALNSPVIANFNNIELVINPGDKAEDVLRQYISKDYKDTDWSKTDNTPESLLKQLMDGASVEKPLKYVSDIKDNIVDVAKNVSELSTNIDGPAVTNFNNVELVIKPGDSVEDVVTQYIDKTNIDRDWSKGDITKEGFLKKLMEESSREKNVPMSNEELRKEIREINEKILQGPVKILKTMTPEEIRVFGSENPNELPYLKDTLTNLYNETSLQNGTLVWENLMKYVRFLEKTRGENYSSDILSQEELQDLKNRRDVFASEIK